MIIYFFIHTKLFISLWLFLTSSFLFSIVLAFLLFWCSISIITIIKNAELPDPDVKVLFYTKAHTFIQKM